jgi:misacylated tRNA(Ala) deacylase
MAGDRAIKLATSSVEAIISLGKMMSSKSSPSEVLTKATEMSEAVTESRRAEKKLLLEIAQLESDRVKDIIQRGRNALIYRANGGIEFTNKIIGEVRDTVSGTGLVVAIAMGEAKGTGPVIITGDKEAVAAVVEKVKTVVTNIKGGGSGNKWQGKVPEWQKDELAEFKALFEQ